MRRPLLVLIGVILAATPQVESVAGGQKTKLEQRPYIVAVFDAADDFHTGTVLTEIWVLSNIFLEPKRIMYGHEEYYKGQSGPTSINIESVVRAVSSNKDIGMLKLVEALPFSAGIHPIRLPPAHCELPQGFADDLVVVGLEGGLSEVQLTPITNAVCSSVSSKVTTLDVCATLKSPNNGPCWRDGGGPAIAPDGTQVGIYFWNLNNSLCGDTSVVQGFLRTEHLISFIEKTAELKLNSEGYLGNYSAIQLQEVEHWHKILDEVHGQLTERENELKAKSDEVAAKTTELQQLQHELETKNAKIASDQAQISKLTADWQQTVADVQSKLDQRDAEVQVKNRDISEKVMLINDLRAQLNAWTAKQAALDEKERVLMAEDARLKLVASDLQNREKNLIQASVTTPMPGVVQPPPYPPTQPPQVYFPPVHPSLPQSPPSSISRYPYVLLPQSPGLISSNPYGYQ